MTKEQNHQINFYLPENLWQELMDYKSRNNIPITVTIRLSIMEFLERQREVQKAQNNMKDIVEDRNKLIRMVNAISKHNEESKESK